MDPNVTPVTTESSKAPTIDVSSKGISYTTGGMLPEIPSRGSSHTHFYRQQRYEPHEFERITRNEYLGIEESVSRSSLSYECLFGPDGKTFTPEGRLKRYLAKQLDPLPTDPEWTTCMTQALFEPSELADTLAFLIQDPTRDQQLKRLRVVLDDFVTASTDGFNMKDLDHVCVILDYLVENMGKDPSLRGPLEALLQRTKAQIHIERVSDSPRLFDVLRNYITYLGYLMMCLEDDALFDIIVEAIMWQLSATKCQLPEGTIPPGLFMEAADTLNQITARMLALTTSHRFKAYLDIALLLAYHGEEYCIDMMAENLIENIFYRFDPYYPEKLPPYDINPVNPQDDDLKLGASSVNISAVMSLMLLVLKNTSIFMKKNPLHRPMLPCPDDHGQSAFIWAYRYECRARDHKHERNTLTAIVSGLLRVFGPQLVKLSRELMPDIFSLAVATELPPRDDWTATVSFNTGQQDALFKKNLILLSVHFLMVFPKNHDLVESRHWLLGLTYLLDPGLCALRLKWSPPLFVDIRTTLMQAMLIALPLTDTRLVQELGLIRRILWYIEWYTEKPFELPTLYWCTRLLQTAIFHRISEARGPAVRDLLETHGIIILILDFSQLQDCFSPPPELCYTLMMQNFPPVEKAQAVLGVVVRLLTSSLEAQGTVTCTVYPMIKWPGSCLTLALKMMDHITEALTNNLIISDRWLISVLNFIWQAIVWNDAARKKFIKHSGIYKLLDLITELRPAAQCIALAIVCDVARAGEAVDQLVTWRAAIAASKAHPMVTKRGSTIAALLASIFRDECRQLDVKTDQDGIIMDEQHPLLSSVTLEAMSDPQFMGSQFSDPRSPVCYAAADLAGSRLSKAYALLSLLSEDLASKVTLLDESYNLYKNVPLSIKDEVTLVLCSHFLTLKLSETWHEVSVQCKDALPPDCDAIKEFNEIGRGWAKEVKRQQEETLNNRRKKDKAAETSLYDFLGRVRLTIALDALRELRCWVRTADYTHLQHALIQDAVHTHHRRADRELALGKTIIKTYDPKLDAKNTTGQHRKVYSALPKEVVEKKMYSPDP